MDINKCSICEEGKYLNFASGKENKCETYTLTSTLENCFNYVGGVDNNQLASCMICKGGKAPASYNPGGGRRILTQDLYDCSGTTTIENCEMT